MASESSDVTDDLRFFKKKFGNDENHVSFSKEAFREQITNCMEDADSDYLGYITGEYMYSRFDPQLGFSVDEGEDPNHALFFSNLKKEGSSYVLQANEKTGLAKPLRFELYEPYEPDGLKHKGQEDLDNEFAFSHDNMRVEGFNVVHQCKNNLVVNDDQILPNSQTDDASSSRKQESKQPIHSEKSKNISEGKSSNHGSNPRETKHSGFKAEIMRILSKPYDRKEHERLMEAITVQKPQNKHIDLRSGGVKFYASNKMGKSLLDYHVDLKRMIQAASDDDLKQLNLLRGFFFWLKNLTREGSFIPWNVEECLAVQPEPC